MLTSFAVKCPHPGCDWFGSLLPERDGDAWAPGMEPRRPIVGFQCPQCHRSWRARMVGDDVASLPLEELAVPLA